MVYDATAENLDGVVRLAVYRREKVEEVPLDCQLGLARGHDGLVRRLNCKPSDIERPGFAQASNFWFSNG